MASTQSRLFARDQVVNAVKRLSLNIQNVQHPSYFPSHPFFLLFPFES